jgi:hypothetical protein
LPLALVGIFAAYLLLNAALHNEHPFADIVTAFGGVAPPVPGRSPVTGQLAPGANPAGGVTTPSEVGSPVASTGTAAVDRILGFVKRLPFKVNIGTICGPGSVPGSQHQKCNAVDLTTGGRKQLFALFHAALVAAKAHAIPCAEVIGPSNNPSWEKGQIATAADGWHIREYTGPNSHQTHVHLSGSPLL